LATSFEDSTKRRRAIEFVVFDDASRAALQRSEVFFAIVVANVKIYRKKNEKGTMNHHESLTYL
jgi:hypothetical protein